VVDQRDALFDLSFSVWAPRVRTGMHANDPTATITSVITPLSTYPVRLCITRSAAPDRRC